MFRRKKDPYEAQAVKDGLKREAQRKQTQLGQEITKTQVKLATFTEGMERRLKIAVNKALMAKSAGDGAALKNAYIDIRMAMRFRALAGGMSSSMARLKSNLDFASVADDMASALESAGELTRQNPSINVGKLDGLYQKAMTPLNNIVEQMERFADVTLADPNDELAISDEEIERVIQQVASGMTPPVEQCAAAQPASAGASSVDALIAELGELAKQLSV